MNFIEASKPDSRVDRFVTFNKSRLRTVLKNTGCRGGITQEVDDDFRDARVVEQGVDFACRLL